LRSLSFDIHSSLTLLERVYMGMDR
jgi:hypothetical protein